MTRFVNNVKTAVLLGAMFGLILLVGFLLGDTTGLTVALVFGVLLNFGAFFFSDKIAIKMMRGQQVDHDTAPDLVEMVSRLAKNAGLPMPRVYICPQEAPNAFATGRSPRHAAVAVTHGALKLLSYDELEGVIGHELAHIRNRDTLTSTIAATIAGVMQWVGYLFIFGDRRDVHPLVLIAMWLLAPLTAAIIQMAISRSREYVADHDGAEIAGTPHGLISALQKLDATAKRIPLQGEVPAQNHMFIVQPLSAGQSFASLFSTHPATAKRIAKLREMA